MRLVFALFILFLLPFNSALASEIIGTVVELEGNATIARSGTPPVALIADDPVYLNDKIETGPGSKLMVLLVDDTEFTLGEDASLVVDEYFYNPGDDAASKGRYSVLKGAFLYTSGLLGKTQQPDVEITTGYGSLGIRGTTVWGGLLDGEYGVLVQEGVVDFKSEAGIARLSANKGAFYNKATRKLRGGWHAGLRSRAVATIALKNPQLKERIARQKEANLTRRQERLENIRERRDLAPQKKSRYQPRQKKRVVEKRKTYNR